MTAFASVPLRKLVLQVLTWNPSKPGSENEVFEYIDLSAIDQVLKVITGSRTAQCNQAPSRARQLVQEGDVLVSTVRPNLNGVAMVPPQLNGATASTGFCVIRANRAVLEPRYAFHWVKSPTFVSNMVAQATGASYPAVSDRIVLDSEIPLPPLPEQRRIAAILDKADALRTKRREALAQLDRLAQSIFVEMFGDPVANAKNWPRHALGDLLSSIDSGWSPVCLERPAEGEEWGVLKLGAVTSCVYDFQANKALPPGVEPVPDIEVKPGDLLFSRKNTHELVAACAFVESTRPRLMMSDLMFRLQVRDENKLNKRFLHGLLTNPRKRAEVQKLAGGSAGSMPNISKAKLLALQIELPPIALQEEFASRVQKAGRMKDTIECAAVQGDLLFSSLQHRAFRGEL